MGTAAKIALLAAGVATAVVLLLLLRPDDDGPAEQVERAEIVVRDGGVSGPERIELERGQQIALVVEADVADEVHVHGYDFLSDVAPGRPAHFDFRADTAGRFEIELHEQQLPLTELVVSP